MHLMGMCLMDGTHLSSTRSSEVLFLDHFEPQLKSVVEERNKKKLGETAFNTSKGIKTLKIPVNCRCPGPDKGISCHYGSIIGLDTSYIGLMDSWLRGYLVL